MMTETLVNGSLDQLLDYEREITAMRGKAKALDKLASIDAHLTEINEAIKTKEPK